MVTLVTEVLLKDEGPPPVLFVNLSVFVSVKSQSSLQFYQRNYLLGSSRTDTFLSARTSSIHTVEHRISLRYYVYSNTLSPLCFSQTKATVTAVYPCRQRRNLKRKYPAEWFKSIWIYRYQEIVGYVLQAVFLK